MDCEIDFMDCMWSEMFYMFVFMDCMLDFDYLSMWSKTYLDWFHGLYVTLEEISTQNGPPKMN